MQEHLKNEVNYDAFHEYLAPFWKKACECPVNAMKRVGDNYEMPKVLLIKAALVMETPWNKQDIGQSYFGNYWYRTSKRMNLFVSDLGNLYIEHEEQSFRFNIVNRFSFRRGFYTKMIKIERIKNFLIKDPSVDIFREFVVELEYNKMLRGDLKKCLVRNG